MAYNKFSDLRIHLNTIMYSTCSFAQQNENYFCYGDLESSITTCNYFDFSCPRLSHVLLYVFFFLREVPGVICGSSVKSSETNLAEIPLFFLQLVTSLVQIDCGGTVEQRTV